MSDYRGRSRSRRGSVEEEEYEAYNRGGRDIRGDRRSSYDRRGGGGDYDRRNRDGSYDRRNHDDSRDRRNRDGSYDRQSDRSGSRDRRGSSDRRGSHDRRGGEDRDDRRRGGENMVRMDSLADPEKRYTLKACIGSGVCGNVYEAIDEDAGGRKVAIKIQRLGPDTERFIIEEYRVLRELSSHPNLPDFYGIYRKRTIKKNEQDEIWFVMQLCEGGSVANMVRGMVASDKKMKEEHIAYILRETIKAVLNLHEHQIMHRDIQASNIVLTKEGEVKLIDFGLSRGIKGEMGKRKTCIGSPCYMAPELVMSRGDSNGYDSRTDVWAIGITAIELADGKPPFQDMHPTRALFQIVRNPPPTLYRQSNWTQTFNDFIAECLEKNPENRPVMPEILEHPFLSELPENDYHLTQELKALNDTMQSKGRQQKRNEMIVHKNFLKSHQTEPPEVMHTEDLAALDHITEDIILDQLYHRLQLGQFHTFVGDVLLVLNPNEDQDIYGPDYHCKYQCKSRSDNAPHIYSVADSAYQDVLHNEEPQNILLAGESNSGKTTNMLHLVTHLMFLGKSLKDIGSRVLKSIKILQAFTNSATPLNPNSTRCMLQIQTTYGNTGKASGAIFWLYQLEKWRVSSRDKNQSNFHILYYFYDGMEHAGKLKKYGMHPGRKQRFLRIGDNKSSSKRSFKVRNDPYGNSAKFEELKEHFKVMEMDEHFEVLWNVLAAVINLGDIRFVEGQDNDAEIHNTELANKVADLLGVDQKKFTWSLTNYCLIKKGAAVRRRHTCDEAKECRDVLANTIYQRLVDWIVNTINLKLTVTRTLFGDKFCINILDLFGFECFSVNRFDQLIINTMNEQLQCYYNQRVFAWEMQEQNEEDIPRQMFHFYDNKDAIEQLMGRNGLFQIIDESSRQMEDAHYILTRLQERKSKNIHIKPVSTHEFSVAHYTGKLVYDASEIAEKNRDYLSLELVETLRQSTFEPIHQMFFNKLSRSGNLTVLVTDTQKQEKKSTKSKWGAALMQETTKLRRCNSASRGQFSQSKKVRTCAATYRSTSLEILKNLSVGAGSGGTHFVRCIRADLEGSARGFYRDVVRQQIRALAVLDTAKARQKGYPHRIPFQEFLRRYKFLAFDFDENVELTKDNCRLLLIRLKMEGWVIGKSKVFLKYYNEEYLSRLYETQVKKIIKVQCMLRAFLAKKNMASKTTRYTKPRKEVVKKASLKKQESKPLNMSEDDAALALQKVYRGHVVRKELGPALKGEMSEQTKEFIEYYSRKWRSKSIFQVLLQYRAARYQDLVQFCQQVHLFNQATVRSIQGTNERIGLEGIDAGVKAPYFLGTRRPPEVNKLPFDFEQELPFFDTSYMNDPSKKRRIGSASSMSDEEHEPWDAPLRRQTVPWSSDGVHSRDVEVQTTNSPHRVFNAPTNGGQSLINTPFSRDPNVPIRCPPDDASRGRVPPNIHHHDSRSPARPINAHIPRSNNYTNSGSIRSRKKEPAPPIPYNQQSRNLSNYSSTNPGKTESNWDHENRANANTRVNPIHELHMIGRQNVNNNDDDAPPYNFQAMLRKTTHHRDSMKRNQVYDSYGGGGTSSNEFYYNPSNRNKNTNESNVVYKSGNRRESDEWNPNELVKMSEKYGREGAWGGGRNEKITTELAPGIIVEGKVADL